MLRDRLIFKQFRAAFDLRLRQRNNEFLLFEVLTFDGLRPLPQGVRRDARPKTGYGERENAALASVFHPIAILRG